mmetsp:Transcript_37390/g.112025  ORF Transcript_37390/g.112025 Transcript_37390/m.112025 type:complete len:96 (-) Transcript_37390:15-302(-)
MTTTNHRPSCCGLFGLLTRPGIRGSVVRANFQRRTPTSKNEAAEETNVLVGGTQQRAAAVRIDYSSQLGSLYNTGSQHREQEESLTFCLLSWSLC